MTRVYTSSMFVPQELADAWALTAQRYAGYFYGVGARGLQLSHEVFLSDKPWQAPYVVEDDCPFCVVLTDERAVERVAGFQHAIDIEVINGSIRYSKRPCYKKWLEKEGITDGPKAKRRFIAEHEDRPTEKRPHGWRRTALNLTALPLYLKRRLCVEWNHVLRDFLADHEGYSYDIEARRLLYVPPSLSIVEEEQRAEAEDLADDIAFGQSVPSSLSETTLGEAIAAEHDEGVW